MAAVGCENVVMVIVAKTTAASLAQQERSDLRKLRALPRLTLPCPVPDFLLQLLQEQVRQQLLVLPHFDRTVHFYPHCVLAKCAGRGLQWSTLW